MIVVFGGTFDPPHLGHAEAIQGLYENPGIDHLWVLPSGNPGGKTPVLPAPSRLELARLAFSALKTGGPLEVLDLEVRWSEAHPGETSTTWKILPELERRAQGEALAWVIGTDQLLSLHRWDRFPDVLSRLHWIVLDRAGASARSDVERVLSEWRASGLLDQQGRIGRSGKTIRLVPTRARELSSTQIRESFARHRRAPEGTLAREVEAHLKLHGLYGSA